MATRRRKYRKSCKHGKLKKPIRTKKGGKEGVRKVKEVKEVRKDVSLICKE